MAQMSKHCHSLSRVLCEVTGRQAMSQDLRQMPPWPLPSSVSLFLWASILNSCFGISEKLRAKKLIQSSVNTLGGAPPLWCRVRDTGSGAEAAQTQVPSTLLARPLWWVPGNKTTRVCIVETCLPIKLWGKCPQFFSSLRFPGQKHGG